MTLFEETGLVSFRYKDDTDARKHQWARTRESMLRRLQAHYGRDFPNAMMRIHAWIETEESYRPEPDRADTWDTWPEALRPLVLRLKVTIR